MRRRADRGVTAPQRVGWSDFSAVAAFRAASTPNACASSGGRTTSISVSKRPRDAARATHDQAPTSREHRSGPRSSTTPPRPRRRRHRRHPQPLPPYPRRPRTRRRRLLAPGRRQDRRALGCDPGGPRRGEEHQLDVLVASGPDGRTLVRALGRHEEPAATRRTLSGHAGASHRSVTPVGHRVHPCAAARACTSRSKASTSRFGIFFARMMSKDRAATS